MPKRKVDYSKGLIYKLCCNDTNIPEVYVGSTVNFRARKNKHKHQVTNENNKDYNSKKSKFIRDTGGWENWKMVLIENYAAKDYRDLESREREWYDKLKCGLNSYKPYTSNEEKKEYQQEYRDNHKEQRKIYDKNYYENNREQKLENSKKYYDEHKEQYQEYRDNHKEQRKIYDKNYYKNYIKNVGIYKCGCGSSTKNIPSLIIKHEKTAKHQEWLLNQLD